MNYDTFKNRLKTAMGEESNYSFAKKCELSEGTLRRYLRGDTFPPLDTLGKIAEVSGYSLAWLASGSPPVMAEGVVKQVEDPWYCGESPEPDDGFVKIPRYKVDASAGGGAVIHSEQIVDHLAFRADWVRNALGVPMSALALINVTGDSMEPTLSNGDLILIDMSTPGVDDSAVYVLRFDGKLVVKRIQRRFDGSVVIMSDNAVYPPETIQGDLVAGLDVIGRVVWCGRRM